ncbi:MAG: hypothetical protein ABID04_00020 [Patescibacteria group bacterium]
MTRVKIAFDLDGVLVGKPFFVPKALLELLVRSPKQGAKKYRFPKSKIEILIRKLSHHWFFRPPLKNNLKVTKRLCQNPKIEAHIISGRYSFLINRTRSWAKKHQLDSLFKSININLDNQQPHLFKEKMLGQLAIDYFFDDDPITVDYLKKSQLKTKIYLVKKDDDQKIKNPDFANLLSA